MEKKLFKVLKEKGFKNTDCFCGVYLFEKGDIQVIYNVFEKSVSVVEPGKETVSYSLDDYVGAQI